MVIDTSAIVAILQAELEAERLVDALVVAGTAAMSAASLFEASVVLETRFGPEAIAHLDDLVTAMNIDVVPFDHTQVELARIAFRRFGRGRHPARLNFGDCFAYALAKQRGEPLLYKGHDFSQTDIESGLPGA